VVKRRRFSIEFRKEYIFAKTNGRAFAKRGFGGGAKAAVDSGRCYASDTQIFTRFDELIKHSVPSTNMRIV